VHNFLETAGVERLGIPPNLLGAYETLDYLKESGEAYAGR
jgi:hypothetical protein